MTNGAPGRPVAERPDSTPCGVTELWWYPRPVPDDVTQPDPARWREVLDASLGGPGWVRLDLARNRTLAVYEWRDGFCWRVSDDRGVVLAHGSAATLDKAKRAADHASFSTS